MSSDRKAYIAHLIRFTIDMVLYSLTIFTKRFWLHSMGGTLWRFIAVLLPIVGACMCAWAMRKMFQEIDEMQRRKVLDTLIASSTGTILTCIAYSFMEGIGLPLLSAPWVMMIQGVSFIIGILWTTWRCR